ncbi:MAG: DNA polymerase III subunit beta [Anaerolineae bacterium]|nr:DNA polymerase III subunit beta [Anaerolineae bacterium]
MNTTVLNTNLSRGLAIVGRAVAGSTTLPVLGHVRIQAVNGASNSGKLSNSASLPEFESSTQQVHLAATDLELSIACQIAAKVAEAGAVALPARTLTDLIGTLGETVALQGEQKIKLASGGVASSLKGLDAADFPDVFGSDGEYEAVLPAALLLEMAARTAFAAATDEIRPALKGVLFRIADDRLTMASADGFRLSVCTAAARVGKAISVIVPARAMSELLRVAKDETQPIRFSVNLARTRAAFHVAGGAGVNETVLGIDLITQLVEGDFPDFEPIIPKTATTRVTVEAGALLEAVKTADIFARDNNHIVTLTIANGVADAAGQMIIKGARAEVGEGVTTLDIVVEGEPSGQVHPTEIAFNARFLIEALKIVEGPVTLGLNGSGSPIALRTVADPDGFVHVIMPMAKR